VDDLKCNVGLFFHQQEIVHRGSSPPSRWTQNDRVSAPLATKKRASSVLTVSYACVPLLVSPLWSRSRYRNWAVPTSFSVEPGANVNEHTIETCCWCRSCSICIIAGDVFVFQQDSAPAHRFGDTVELLRRETLQFVSPAIWTANSPALNPVDYRI